MKLRFEFVIWIALFLLTSGCAQMRSGPSQPEIVSARNKTHEMHFGMARIAERNGKLESARRAYLEILEQDPGNVASLHRMAVTSVQVESLDEAIEYFERAIELAEPTGELLADYGYAFYLADDFEAAEAALEQARKNLPSDPRVVNNLALVLGRQGKYDEAYELFQQSGDRAEALANLAYVQSQAGDISFAKENYHQALGIDPTLTVAANGLFEIHQAFPDHDSMLIKPYRGGFDGQSERLASHSSSDEDVDQLIRAISIKPEVSSKPRNNPPVVQASYQTSIERFRLPAVADYSDGQNREENQGLTGGSRSQPERADTINAKRIPNQSLRSSRRAPSSVSKYDSSSK